MQKVRLQITNCKLSNNSIFQATRMRSYKTFILNINIFQNGPSQYKFTID